jgi:hypothetical protein
MSNFVHTPHQTRLSLRHLKFLVVFALTAATLTAFTASRTADASSSAGFNPIVPRRVRDTRSGFGGPVFGPGMTRQLSLAATVPAGATGVVLNLAATEPTANTFITVWPAGNPRPTSSNLNVQAGQTRANAVMGLMHGSVTSDLACPRGGPGRMLLCRSRTRRSSATMS